MAGAVSNADFLRAIFDAEWQRAHVATFAQDPSAMTGEEQRRAWAGGAARDRLARCTPDRNTYFCVSTFTPDADGRQRRRKADFAGQHVIVFDDVGTGPSAKVAPAKITSRGLLPSYRLQTSPGNEQWGFILAQPETNRARAEALIDGLIASGLVENNKDPGQSGVTRYVRLPVGTNLKAKYGPGGFRHQLTEWRPERRVTAESMARAWDIDLSAVSQDSGERSRVLGRGEVHARNHRNYVFRLLDLLGLVRDELSEPGKFAVRCPFCELHTGGDESGTAWLPREGVIFCQHGHGTGAGGDNTAQERYVRQLEALMLEDGRGAEMRGLRHELAVQDFKDADVELRTRIIDQLRVGAVPDVVTIAQAAMLIRPTDLCALIEDAEMLAAPGVSVAAAVRTFRAALAREKRDEAPLPLAASPPRLLALAELEAWADQAFADATAVVIAAMNEGRGSAT